MEEKVFYSQGGVTVTQSRFVVGSQTYAIRNVTSVKSHEIVASKAGLILMLIIGVIVAFNAISNLSEKMGVFLFGAGLAVLAFFLIKSKKNKYAVLLTTSGREEQALTSEDKGMITQIVNALNESIIYRG